MQIEWGNSVDLFALNLIKTWMDASISDKLDSQLSTIDADDG